MCNETYKNIHKLLNEPGSPFQRERGEELNGGGGGNFVKSNECLVADCKDFN